MAVEKEEKEVKYRIGAYVNRETYEKIMRLQTEGKIETGIKPSQGDVLNKVFKNV